MKIIGITGGIGSGKSQVLKYLEEEYGAHVCQADQVAKNLQRKGTNCYHDMVAYFGKEILTEEGKLNRETIAKIVFSDKKELEELNKIVHPAVKKRILEEIQKKKKAACRYFVLEAALLLEDGYDAVCDEIWYIYTDEEIRKRRLAVSRSYKEEKIEAVIRSQLSKEQFLNSCDRVVDNNDTFVETAEQIDEIMKEIGRD